MSQDKPVEIPKNIKVVGVFKLKDKEGRDRVGIKVIPEAEGIIIQKVKGQSSKIIVAYKLFDTDPQLVPANEVATDSDKQVVVTQKETKEGISQEVEVKNGKPKEETKS